MDIFSVIGEGVKRKSDMAEENKRVEKLNER